MPVIVALGRIEDCSAFEASLNYRVRLSELLPPPKKNNLTVKKKKKVVPLFFGLLL